MNTIEAAITSAALVLLTVALVGALVAIAGYTAAIDAAGAGARAIALGLEPPGEGLDWTVHDGWVTVTATRHAMTATATFPLEQP